MGLLDWLFSGAQAQTIPPVPQGAVPQPVPNTVPQTGNPFGMNRDVQIQAALAGLGQFGQNLAEQYRRRPVGAQPGPTGNVSDAVARSLATAYQRRQQEREDESERRWSELQAQNPALAGLPREVGQQVLARTLTREPPDPRRNFITTRTGIYRIGADGNPQLVQGPGMGGGGAGGAGSAAAGGAPFGASEESRAWGVLLNPASDPSSPLYHAAYSIISRPRLQPVPDPNNPMGTMLAEVRPEIPTNIRRPGGAAATPSGPMLQLGPPVQGPTGYVGGDVMGGGLPESSAAPPTLAQPTQQPAATTPTPAAAPPSAQGRVTPIPGTERPGPEPSGEQRIAAGYAARMDAAERILGRLTESGYAAGNLRDNLASRTPLVGNYAISNQGQQYRQAQEDWVRAKLRRESGAVIGDDEMEREIRVYFPQPGDSAETIAQKARARRIAQQAMVQDAGRAYQRPEIPSADRIQMMPLTEIQGVVDRWDELNQAQRAALRRRLGLEPQ